jgi:hypothetical protein
MKKLYPAIILRQRKSSPLQVAFAASSAEIDAWARVPTKRTGNIRNFQRAELKRHSNEISRFFALEENSSPTAVVVGFDGIRAANRVTTLDEKGKAIVEKDVPVGEPIVGSIQIEWEDPRSFPSTDAQVARIGAASVEIRRFIYSELKDITGLDEERAGKVEVYLADRIKAGFDPDPKPKTESEDSTAEEDEEEDTATEAIIAADAPDDVRTALAGLSPSERQVVIGRLSFLALLRKDILEAKPAEAVEDVFRMVADELKPGILIDGQHRVMGTKELGSIPFLVTALPLASWSELAFQFIVTNRTAKRVPESLLISIIGNSLSKTQREQIEGRLREAGIRVGLIEAVMRVHEDAQSPFYGFLAFGLKNETGFLDAAAMRGKVIQPWFERQGAVQFLFDHFCEGKRKGDRTDYWKSEDLWFEFFVAFWSAVRERYKDGNVFTAELSDPAKKTPYSKLMSATVLMIFQNAVLKHLEDLYTDLEGAQNIPVSSQILSETQFQETIKNTLAKLTPDFFSGWQLSGFDGSRQVQQDLEEAITSVIKQKRTVAQLKDPKKPHRLFKAQSK